MFNYGGCSGYSLADVAAVTGGANNNSGGFGWGGDGWWIILLFLFAGWGGNGWGGNGGGSTTREEIAYGFDINGLENSTRGIQQGLCDGFYAMNTGMLNGFSGVQSTLCQGFAGVNSTVTNATADIQQSLNTLGLAGMQNTNALTAQLNAMAADNAACCCETQRAIERGLCDLNYNIATQSCDTRRAIADSTRDIVDNANSNTRAILDFLTQDKIASLTAENQSLKFAASQAAQNAYLVNELSDKCPIPAYVVPNPNCCYNNYGYGYGFPYANTGCCA